MDDIVVLAITMLTLGQIVFCLPQLFVRAIHTSTYIPLIIFFAAQGVIALGPAVFLFFPERSTLYIAAIFPAWLLLAPSLWLYVQGLTSDTPWHIKTKHIIQLIPFIFGLVVMGLIVSLPLEIQQTIFSEDSDIDSGWPLVVVLSIFMAMLLWAVQSGYYVVRIVIRLSHYRKKLKDLFASNEQRELGWFSWLLAITAGTWLLAFASLLSTLIQNYSLFGYRFGAVLLLVLVWTLAYWGLRQKPGFDGRYTNKEEGISDIKGQGSTITQKYVRSALSKAQSQRIADKIDAIMDKDQLYLDSSLSLQKLAKHVVISPNYISQTLNETMGISFFDYVNKWRIKAAKPKVITNEDTVLNIALDVGFNARSSFYNAFKKEMGITPTQYRKSYCVESNG